MKKISTLTFFVSFLSLMFASTLSPQSAETTTSRSPVSPFRYVIIENRIEKSGPENSRTVEVLLDRKAFSERNLLRLFALVSKRFPDEQILDVWVYTSLEEAPTPEEREEGGTSGQHDQRTKEHYWAFYFRSVDYEYFRYSPLNDKSDNKLVQLKGR